MWGTAKSVIDVQVFQLWVLASLSILLRWDKGDADSVIHMPIKSAIVCSQQQEPMIFAGITSVSLISLVVRGRDPLTVLRYQ